MAKGIEKPADVSKGGNLPASLTDGQKKRLKERVERDWQDLQNIKTEIEELERKANDLHSQLNSKTDELKESDLMRQLHDVERQIRHLEKNKEKLEKKFQGAVWLSNGGRASGAAHDAHKRAFAQQLEQRVNEWVKNYGKKDDNPRPDPDPDPKPRPDPEPIPTPDAIRPLAEIQKDIQEVSAHINRLKADMAEVEKTITIESIRNKRLTQLEQEKERLVQKLNNLQEEFQSAVEHEANKTKEAVGEYQSLTQEEKDWLSNREKEIQKTKVELMSVENNLKAVNKNKRLSVKERQQLTQELEAMRVDLKERLANLENEYKQKKVEFANRRENAKEHARERGQEHIDKVIELLRVKATEGLDTKGKSAKEFLDSMSKWKRLALYAGVGVAVSGFVFGAGLGASALGLGIYGSLIAKFGAGVIGHKVLKRTGKQVLDKARAVAGFEKAVNKMKLNKTWSIGLVTSGELKLNQADIERAFAYIDKGKKGVDRKLLISSLVATAGLGAYWHFGDLAQWLSSLGQEHGQVLQGATVSGADLQNLTAPVDNQALAGQSFISDPGMHLQQAGGGNGMHISADYDGLTNNSPLQADAQAVENMHQGASNTFETQVDFDSSDVANTNDAQMIENNLQHIDLDTTGADWFDRIKDANISLDHFNSPDKATTFTEAVFDKLQLANDATMANLSVSDAHTLYEIITQNLGANGHFAPGAEQVLNALGTSDINLLQKGAIYNIGEIFKNEEFFNAIKELVANDARFKNPNLAGQLLDALRQVALNG